MHLVCTLVKTLSKFWGLGVGGGAPLKRGILWTWLFLQNGRIFPGVHKIGAAISGHRIGSSSDGPGWPPPRDLDGSETQQNKAHGQSGRDPFGPGVGPGRGLQFGGGGPDLAVDDFLENESVMCSALVRQSFIIG